MKKISDKGFTLIESLVAMVIGMIAIGAMYFAYQYFNSTYKSIVDRAEISSNSRHVLSIISKDLRNAGYKNKHYSDSYSFDEKIKVENNNYHNADKLTIWYNKDKNTKRQIEYWITKDNNQLNLVQEVYETKGGKTKKIFCTNYQKQECIPIVLVENVTDFQIILRDKNGKEIPTVNQSNQDTVHTAEVYLTLRSENELYRTEKEVKVNNNYNSSTGREISTIKDKFLRETFFLSVYLRNLAKT